MKKTLAFILLFFVAALLFTVQAQSTKAIRKKVLTTADSGRRSALVIGNAAYASKPLRNSVNDARAMSSTLRELGFSVELLEDASQKEMKKAIDRFGQKLRDGGTGLFYFSGHGIQVSGRNYLIPVKYTITSEDDVEYESVDAGRVLAKMKAARNGMNIVILDACRNNPFPSSFRSASQGLATINAPSGTFISYATAPGSVASDGSGNIGLYTGELIRNMKSPGLKLEEVFKKVRADVQKKSSDKQVPWDASSLTGDFYFVPPTIAPDSAPEVTGTAALTDSASKSKISAAPRKFREDEEAWVLVKNSDDLDDFQFFLDEYPESSLRSVARLKLRILKKKQKKLNTTQQRVAEETKKLEEELKRLKMERARIAKAERERQREQVALNQKKPKPQFRVSPRFFKKVFQFRGHTYALSNKNMGNAAGRRLANKHGGYMITLNNSEEDRFIVKSYLSSRNKYLWVGFNDIGNEGKWSWFGPQSNYTNWLPSQPGYNNTKENCAAYIYPDKKWHDVPCYANKRVIVEWDKIAGNAISDISQSGYSNGTQSTIRQAYDKVLKQNSIFGFRNFIKEYEHEQRASYYVNLAKKKLKKLQGVTSSTVSSGTVIDSSTGLMWQKKPDGQQRNWDEAKNYCRDLNHGGFSDWKLPNGKELRQLLGKYQIFDPYKLTGTWDSSFWSSQTASYLNAFLVNFGTGKSISFKKRSKHYVRCVREGKAQESKKITKKKLEGISKTASLTSIRQTYDKAVNQNSIFGFRNFIKEYEHEQRASYYVNLAKKKLKKLEGVNEPTTTSSSEASSGYTKRQAYLDFLEAKTSNTKTALRNFLRKHAKTPDSESYRVRARKLIKNF